MKALMPLIVILAATQFAQAADIEAGKQLATTVCAACHGSSGISVSDTVPNLAGQRARYIEAQLKFFKDGTRKEPGSVSRAAIMNAIAAQLSAEEIANVAAYFESQPGATPGTKSALLPNIAATKVAFPEDYKQAFTKYHTINFPAAKEVRHYYANPAVRQRPRRENHYLMNPFYSPRCIRQSSTPTIIRSRAPMAFTFRTGCCATRLWNARQVGGTISPNFSATKIGITRFSQLPNDISKVSIRLNVWPATSPCPT